MTTRSEQSADVSVVIATLGGGALRETIDQLNRGTIVPREILICIPEAHADRVAALAIGNVKVVRTTCRGQVAQRAIGFRTAASSWVLQLDDDILLEHTCLETLFECMKGRAATAIGPTMVDLITGLQSPFMRMPKNNGVLHRLMFAIANGANGYEPGKISKAGVNMALSDTASEAYEVEWLPGGCVLHAREHLVLEAFYPFPGKAYSEDLYHSTILRSRGMTLVHCPRAVCRVDFSSSKAPTLGSFARVMVGFSRAMLELARRTGKSRLRFSLFLPVYVTVLVTSRLSRR